MKIKLEIADIQSPDVGDLANWSPKKPEDVFILLQLEICEYGKVESDIFQVVVATPDGLGAHHVGKSIVILDRSVIVLSEYCWKEIKEHLESIVKSCESETWIESVLRLQRYFHWEYEDHIVET